MPLTVIKGQLYTQYEGAPVKTHLETDIEMVEGLQDALDNAGAAPVRDTAAGFRTSNTVLQDGALGFETDTKQVKIGDGTTRWNDLSYINGAHVDEGVQIVTSAAAVNTATTNTVFQIIN